MQSGQQFEKHSHRSILAVFLDGIFFEALIVSLMLAMVTQPSANAFELEAVYTGDVWRNVSGGVEQGTAYLDNLSIVASADLADDIGIGEGSVWFQVLNNNHSTFSDRYVGDLQAISNIDAPGALRVFEALYDYSAENWSLRAGLYDLNSEFDVNNVGGLFLHSSHGIGVEIAQTGENGPGIFPISSLAARFEYRLDDLAMRFAVLDGVPGDRDDPTSNRIRLSRSEGFLTIAELDLMREDRYRLWGGYWYYTQESAGQFDNISGATDNNSGLYVGGELFRMSDTFSSAYFLRYGIADSSLNIFSSYIGAGAVFTPIRDGRTLGQFGIALAAAESSRAYRDSLNASGGRAENWEVNVELSYRLQANDWLSLQPDLQWVLNPSANGNIKDAVVIGLRFEIDAGQMLGIF